NASALDHARGGDDDGRSGQRVQRLGLGDVAHVANQREVEDLVGLQYQLFAAVENFRVHPEYLGGVHTEGTVDIDRDLGNLAAAEERVQRVDDLLDAAEREGGYENLAAPGGDGADDFPQLPLGVVHRGVIGVGVGRFDDEGVDHARGRIGIADDRQVVP